MRNSAGHVPDKKTLRKNNEFNAVYSRGRSKGGQYVVVLYKRNRFGFTRKAFVASKKVGNSVERNRARRLMRAAYRSIFEKIKEGYDIVFVARNTIRGRCEAEVERSMTKSLKNAGLIHSEGNKLL